MSEMWGVAIPGLAMRASELPALPGLLRLENPEIGEGPLWDRAHYTLVDVAEWHAKTIQSLGLPDPLVLGMSMGGMIVSIMASHWRHLLPEKTTFRVLASSPNLRFNQAVTPERLASWQMAHPGHIPDFARVLAPFFSDRFLKDAPAQAHAYYRYRAYGENQQSGHAFYRQIMAILDYDGSVFWPHIAPHTMTVVGGGHDKVLGPSHSANLKSLLPGAEHLELAGLGHMMNLEQPDLFARHLRL